MFVTAGPRLRLHVLPTLWFRNTWTWSPETTKPVVADITGSKKHRVLLASHPHLGNLYLYCTGAPQLLFTENETNNERSFGASNASPYVKDGISDFLESKNRCAINPERKGTEASAHYQV